MSKTNKKVSRVLNYIDHTLIVICTISECVSIWITRSSIRLNNLCNDWRNKKI